VPSLTFNSPALRWFLTAFTVLPGSLLAQSLAGTWQGVVRSPTTDTDQRTVVKIVGSDGETIKANFYSIDQSVLAFPATLTLQNSVVKMNIPGIGAVYEAKLSADGNTMAGSIKQGFPFPVPWTLKRVSEKEAWALPKPPAPPKPMAADADPVFEVATIKLTPADVRGMGIRLQGTTFSTQNMMLMNLMAFAYDIHQHQISGAPAWASEEKYSITAKPDGEGMPSQQQWRVMLRKLIVDRFQLKFQRDRQELPVYTLAVAKAGLKISKSEAVNGTPAAIFRAAGSLSLNNESMGDFSRLLQANVLDRPVVDQTGLAGRYDFSLVWTPDQLMGAAPNPNAIAPPPDLFTAVQQQLGLKLDAAKVRVEVFVIDKVEKPSEN
jgi:uncharacterized protein (TIGR03435 family)